MKKAQQEGWLDSQFDWTTKGMANGVQYVGGESYGHPCVGVWSEADQAYRLYTSVEKALEAQGKTSAKQAQQGDFDWQDNNMGGMECSSGGWYGHVDPVGSVYQGSYYKPDGEQQVIGEFSTKEKAMRAVESLMPSPRIGAQKVAVDQAAKSYFTAYFTAYGAQLVKDVALKKMAKKAQQDPKAREQELAAMDISDLMNYATELGMEASWDADRRDLVEFCMKQEQGKTAQQKTTAVAKEDIEVAHEPGEVIETGTELECTIEADGSVEVYDPDLDVRFGYANVEDAEALGWSIRKQAQMAPLVFAKDVPDLGVLAGDKFSVVPSSDPNQVILYGDVANKSGMDGIPVSRDQLMDLDDKGFILDASRKANQAGGRGPDFWNRIASTAPGEKGYTDDFTKRVNDRLAQAPESAPVGYEALEVQAPVKEEPNHWAVISPNVMECDYTSGGHGCVEQNADGTCLATYVAAAGWSAELPCANIGEGCDFCNEQDLAAQKDEVQPVVAAKSATQTLRKLQSKEATQRLAEELQAQGAVPVGWEVIDTGGGCKALMKDLGNGRHALATDEGGTRLPVKGEMILVGVYQYAGDTDVEIGYQKIAYAQDSDLDNAVAMIMAGPHDPNDSTAKQAQSDRGWHLDMGDWVRIYGDEVEAVVRKSLLTDEWVCTYGGHPFAHAGSEEEAKKACDDRARAEGLEVTATKQAQAVSPRDEAEMLYNSPECQALMTMASEKHPGYNDPNSPDHKKTVAEVLLGIANLDEEVKKELESMISGGLS